MPVAAVAAAVFAGAEIATVGVAAMSAFQVVAAVGAIAAGIGTVTGNQDLVKIGSIASMVGGVGAFAQGKGWIGGDVAKAGSGGAIAGATDASNTSKMLEGAAPGVVDPSAAVAANPAATAGVMGATPASGAGAGALSAAASGAPTGLINTAADAMGGAVQALKQGGEKTMSMLGSVGEWMEKNKNVTAMLSNFVGGALDEKKDAETDILKAQAKNEALKGNIAAQQAANGSAVPDLTGLKVDTSKNIYGKTTPPVYYGVKPAGLINK
jgi:hypothetical protein